MPHRPSRASRPETPGPSTRPNAPRAATVLPPGTRLGRYVVAERLGQGGMGTVHAGHDHELDRRVALKVVRPKRVHRNAFDNVMRGLFGDEPTPTRAPSVEESRLLREAQAAASLSHPNVITIHDVGRSDAGVFIAMELVEGQTLRQWLRAKRRPPAEALEVLGAAGRGLAAAHEAGLVHRDFKPDNVMVADDGRVLVLDFGLVREEEGRASDAPVPSVDALSEELTGAGAVVGTPGYMAPEQCYGYSTDARTDQFSFCVTVWEALVGHRPFYTAIPDLLDDPLEPPGGPGMPHWRFEVLRRGMSIEPRHRYASMDALLEAIADNPHRGRRRKRVLVWLAALGALAASSWPFRSAILRARCASDAESITAIWNDDVRAALSSALTSTGASYAEATALDVESRLDAFAESWRDVRRQACEANAFGDDPDGLAAGTIRCLDVRADTLVALLEHHHHALELARAVERGGHPGLLVALNNLAGSLADAGRHDESRALLEEAIVIQRESLPERHPDVAMTLTNLARLYWIAEDTAAALDASERALSIFLEVLGPDHPQVGAAHGNLALMLRQAGRLSEALKHLEHAQRIATTALPTDHPRHDELAGRLERLRAEAPR